MFGNPLGKIPIRYMQNANDVMTTTIEKMHLRRIVKSILTLYHTARILYFETMLS